MKDSAMLPSPPATAQSSASSSSSASVSSLGLLATARGTQNSSPTKSDAPIPSGASAYTGPKIPSSRYFVQEALEKTSAAVNSAIQQAASYSTSRKKGELNFKANFESGNLSKVHVIQEGIEYELFIRPDTNNHAYRLWFYFSVQNVRKNQRVLFTIVNFSKTRSLYRQGMTPLVRCEGPGRRTNWERLPEKSVFYYRSQKHQRGYVLSFVVNFDREDDVYYFAYCYPYTYTNLQRFLYHIDRRDFAFYKRDLLGRTVQNRRLDLLTITSASNMDPLAASSSSSSSPATTTTKKTAICITARVHPGETPASFICHGIISFLISDHPQAKHLRELYIFKIIPMLNPDGVFLGNYRCSSTGFDLNRQFLHPLDWAHPEVIAIRNFLIELRENPFMDLDYYIDIHSHSTAQGGFVYISNTDDPVKREESLLFPRLLDHRSKEFSFNDSKTCKDPSKQGTGRRALGETMQLAKYCYTLEVSFSSYMDNQRIVPFTEEAYINLGKNMCLTFLDVHEAKKKAASAAVPSATT